MNDEPVSAASEGKHAMPNILMPIMGNIGNLLYVRGRGGRRRCC